MQTIIQEGGFALGPEQAAFAQAAQAIVALTIAITVIAPAATTGAVSLTNLVTATRTLSATATLAAQQARIAATTITAAFATIVDAAQRAYNTLIALVFAAAVATRDRRDPDPRRNARVTSLQGDHPFLGAARRLASPAQPAPAAAAVVHNLNVTVDREHPRAVQAGVERALAEIGRRVAFTGALD